MADPCPSEDELLAWAQGRLPSQRRRALELHIDTCDACAVLLATAARDPTVAPPRAPAVDTPLPSRFDRYRIESRLGRGGMGVVYAAFDERLGRRVALKVLRGDRSLDVELLRAEARALAALQHPHVVTVYEVGRLPGGGDVYIAMELVEGADLRRVFARGRADQDEILDLFVQAGRGLAAAHSALLVHRDFKPDNVLVGADGRVRVTDFGLACTHASSTADASGSLSSATTDHVAGTPGYMAPEQLAGGPPDPRWDQFAFCVALWEALTGHRPPRREDVRRTIGALPRALRRVLLRGLADDPSARHPSMTVLLAELGRARRRPTWMLPIAAGATLAACVGIASGGADEPCRGAASTSWWVDGSRPVLADAFAALDSPIVAREGARAMAHLDRYAARSGDAAHAACVAARDEPRTTACLASTRARADELTALLVEDPARAVRGLDGLLRALPEPEACIATDTTDSAAMIETRDALVSARLLLEAGRYDDAVARTATIVEHARTLGDAEALASALAEHGMALVRAGAYADAIARSREAHELATTAGADLIAALAAYRIAFAELELERPESALEWIRHARAACDRIADPVRREETTLVVDGVHTSVLARLGRTDEARAIATRVLQATEARAGPDDPDLVVALGDVASVCFAQHDFDCAESHLVRALAIAESAWGEAHPRTTIVVNNLGHLDEQRERFPDAARWFARALRDSEAVLGADHPDVARAHYNVGVVSDRVHDYDAARRELGQALAGFVAALGEDHPVVAKTLHNLGAVALAEQEFAEAERLYARAQGIVERTLGASDHELTRSLLGRAEAAIGRGDGAAALALIDRASLIEREHGLPLDVESLFRLARAQRTNGDGDAARRTAKAALALTTDAEDASILREFIATTRAAKSSPPS